jgi:hypothetical protein
VNRKVWTHGKNVRRFYVTIDNEREKEKLKRDGWIPLKYEDAPLSIRTSSLSGTWFYDDKGGRFVHEGMTYDDLPRGGDMR